MDLLYAGLPQTFNLQKNAVSAKCNKSEGCLYKVFVTSMYEAAMVANIYPFWLEVAHYRQEDFISFNNVQW